MENRELRVFSAGKQAGEEGRRQRGRCGAVPGEALCRCKSAGVWSTSFACLLGVAGLSVLVVCPLKSLVPDGALG